MVWCWNGSNCHHRCFLFLRANDISEDDFHYLYRTRRHRTSTWRATVTTSTSINKKRGAKRTFLKICKGDSSLSRSLKILFLVTDTGFIFYWTITFFEWIPKEYLYQNYQNPLLVTWNWSFFPLDILVSITGILAIYLNKMQDNRWRQLALLSLTLTFCSGLQAIVFWTIRLDFDLVWWIPNLYLLVYPLFFIKSFIHAKP